MTLTKFEPADGGRRPGRYRGHPTKIGLGKLISFDDALSHSDRALDKLITFLLLPVNPSFKFIDMGQVDSDRYEQIAA